MATNDGFDTSTLSFGGSPQAPLTSLQHSDSAAEIDVTGSTDVIHYFETGLSNPTITAEIIGASSGTALSAGTTGALVVTFNSTGTAVTHTLNALVTSNEQSGSLDGELTTSLTFRPT